MHPVPCFTVNVWPPAVMLPVRPGPAFAATVKRTVPVPEPFAPAVTVSQELEDVAVQPQPAADCTSNDPWPPLSPMSALEGERRMLQPSPCSIVKVCPAMRSVADLDGPLVPATLNRTSPLPVPLDPDVIVAQAAELVAVQEQPEPAVTVTVPDPPLDGTDWRWGEIANVHPWAWETETCCPATVNVPERAGPDVAATANATLPEPRPSAGPCSVIQLALLTAVHAHPDAVVMLTLAVPPATGTLCVAGATV